MLRSIFQKLSTGARKLTSLEWAFIVALWLPIFAYHLTLRTIRVVHRGDLSDVVRAIDVYKSDVLFHVGFVVVVVSLLILLRARRARFAAFAAAQGFVLFVTSVELAAFNFFTATGSTLDFQLIFFTLSQLAETYDIVASETPGHIWIMLSISSACAVALPWGVYVGLRRWRGASEPPVDPEAPRRRAVAALLVGLIIAGASLLPPFAEQSYAFARNAFVNVAVSAVDSVRDAMHGEAIVTRTHTKNARLVARKGVAKKRNVVIILLESTRARSVSLYNPELETTPHLVELGKKSLVADRAYAVVPHTSKALVASLCGIEPRLHMPITEALPDGIPGRCLADLLEEEGWKTAFFQSATQRFEDRPSLTENMGYTTFMPLERLPKKGFAKSNYFGHEDDIMLEPSGRWIDQLDGEPFFLTYLTLTPHHNYLAPRRYGRHSFVQDDELNRYLNSVHYVDAFVNNVIEMFKEKGLYEDTIFVIVGDHGEGFREHGRSQHDNVIWEEGLHVPLLIHDPTRWQNGERLPYLVNQLDILPTVVDLLGYDIEGAEFPGASMVELDRQRTMRAHCWYERRCMASIFENEKFIYHFEQRPDEYFDLAVDPLEKRDRLDELTDADERRRDLIMWRAGVNAMYRAHNRGRLEKHVLEERPAPRQPRDVTFGGWAKLIGVDAPEERVTPGSNVTISYYFEVIEELPAEWKFFVHGEAKGIKMQNLDHVPVNGLYPLEDWEPGQFIVDTHTFQVPLSARDEYTLWVGFWHPEDGRAPLSGTTADDGANRAEAAVLELAPRPRPKPRLKRPALRKKQVEPAP